MKTVNTLFVILFTSSVVLAQRTQLNLDRVYYGRPVETTTARSLGLSGAGLAAGDAFMAAYNPALLVNARGMLSINAGLDLYNLEEDRSFPYYDSFNDFLDYGSYYFQDNWYENVSAQVVYRLPVDSLLNAHVSLGYMPFLDFSYDYLEEVRSTSSDALLGYNRVKSSGEINAVPIMVALTPMENWAIGFSGEILTGAPEYLESIEPKDDRVKNLEYHTSINPSLTNTPIVATAGATYVLNKRLTVGASYRGSYTMNYDAGYTFQSAEDSLKVNRSLEYPARLGLGLDYRFQNILAARLMIDYYYEFWGNFKDNWSPRVNFVDTYNFHVGVEHIFFNKMPFRAGFSYGTLKESKSYTKTVLSVGTGLVYGAMRIDLGVGFSSIEYYQSQMWDNSLFDSGLTFRSEPDRIRWYEVFSKIDLNYSF